MSELAVNPYSAALDNLRAQPTHKLKEVGDQWRTPDPLWWGMNSMFGPFVLRAVLIIKNGDNYE
ncbi:hypothetical protein NS381_05965 [Pantoea stewartii]|nr:hypothetical protein NS381_05965 [Pantoea stewartii]